MKTRAEETIVEETGTETAGTNAGNAKTGSYGDFSLSGVDNLVLCRYKEMVRIGGLGVMGCTLEELALKLGSSSLSGSGLEITEPQNLGDARIIGGFNLHPPVGLRIASFYHPSGEYAQFDFLSLDEELPLEVMSRIMDKEVYLLRPSGEFNNQMLCRMVFEINDYLKAGEFSKRSGIGFEDAFGVVKYSSFLKSYFHASKLGSLKTAVEKYHLSEKIAA